MRTHTYSVFLILSLLYYPSFQGSIHAQTSSSSSPNFILILADDLGWSCLSSLMDDNQVESRSDYFETPSLDRLASTGIRFTQGYAPAALCSPTRRGIQFGQTPIRLGAETFKERYHPAMAQHLTIPQVLKAANPDYRTAHYGKWDLRGDIFPEDLGYDESDGNTGNGHGNYGSNKSTKWKAYFPNNDPKRIESLTARANNFMKRQTLADRPFFLQLSHYATHVDMQAKPDTYAKYTKKKKGVKHYYPAWAAMLEDLDTGIGKLMDAVQTLGIEDNTYIIFMTDNGAAESVPPIKNKHDHPSKFDRPMRNHPLRGGKWVLYEGGIRVPFIVVGPGIEAGSQSPVPIGGWDILPTLADLSNSPIEMTNELDGGSFASVLHRESSIVDRLHDAFFFHRYHRAKPHSAITKGEYKLIKYWKNNKRELYRLSNDLGETIDLFKEMPEKVKELETELHEYLESVDAEILTQFHSRRP
ncbi:MAG: sulfatase [Bacteroidota bacterium]